MNGFISAYLLTLAIETIVLYALLKDKYPAILIIRNSIIASSLTLPFVWFVFPVLGFGSWVQQTAIAEIFAFFVEAVVYRFLFNGMGWRDAAFVSFSCNAVSFVAGLILF